ncbi:MgtC/SapB family protein [Paraliobacillus salinarum]|uniref:MgtC/SapB family protein n=1 Tax=Paraliobacillus salinarum TaxID=1158996 RepID=UPI0015F721A0|nr:MgtC/SapB family protein [Paraliobacillus salinarum]
MIGIVSWFDQEFLTISARMVIALLLSGLIGFEREVNQHAAGFRTHILVGVSACLMMLLSIYGFTEYLDDYDDTVRFDPTRIPSYVISGIGFLGAGTIIVNGMTVKGLTTAASIWAVAGLGLVVGIGMYKEAILTTIIILLSLIFLNKIEKKLSWNKSSTNFLIVLEGTSQLNELFIELEQFRNQIRKFEVDLGKEGDRVVWIELDGGKELDKLELYQSLLKMDFVKQIKSS